MDLTNLAIPKPLDCSFYEGYFQASQDLGSLLVKIALIFALLEILHQGVLFTFTYLKKRFKFFS